MKRFIRYRRLLSTASLFAFVFGLGLSATPAQAHYNPKLGRFLQRDANGTALVLSPELSQQAMNPTVTVNMAYELQFGDGMNFYEYLKSTPPNKRDPSGLSVRAFDQIPLRRAASGALSNILAASMALEKQWEQGWGDDEYGDTILDLVGDRSAALGLLTTATVKALRGKSQALAYGVAATNWLEFWMTTMAPDVQAASIAPLMLGRLALSPVRLASRIISDIDIIQGAARRALKKAGPGKGPVYGSRVHKIFEQEVKALGRGFNTEVSYAGGKLAKRGQKGSIRADVVVGSVEHPIAIFDLKTGTGRLTQSRIRQIRSHLPDQHRNVPILEIRGD